MKGGNRWRNQKGTQQKDRERLSIPVYNYCPWSEYTGEYECYLDSATVLLTKTVCYCPVFYSELNGIKIVIDHFLLRTDAVNML